MKKHTEARHSTAELEKISQSTMQSHKGIHGLVFVLCCALALAAPHGKQKRSGKDCCGNLGSRAQELLDAYKEGFEEFVMPTNMHWEVLPNCIFSEEPKAEEGCAVITAFLDLFKQFNRTINDDLRKIAGEELLKKIADLTECRLCFQLQGTVCPEEKNSHTRNIKDSDQLLYYYAFQEYQSCMLDFTNKIEFV